MAPENDVVNIPQPMVQDTALLDFINEVQMYYTGAKVSATALTSMTSQMKEGPIRKCDTASIYTYQNTLYKLEMNGAQLRSFMEWSAGFFKTWVPGDLTVAFDPSTRYYLYDAFEGVNYEIDVSQEPGGRIRNLTWPDGSPVRDEEVFTVAVNNYRATTQLLIAADIFAPGEPLPKLLEIDVRGDPGRHPGAAGRIHPHRQGRGHPAQGQQQLEAGGHELGRGKACPGPETAGRGQDAPAGQLHQPHPAGRSRHRGGPGCGEVTLCPQNLFFSCKAGPSGPAFSVAWRVGFSTIKRKKVENPSLPPVFFFGASWYNIGRKPEKGGESMQHSTIAAIATAPGAGGIAVVRLSGPESYAVAQQAFRPQNPAKRVQMPRAIPHCSAVLWRTGRVLTREWPCSSGRPTAIPGRMWWSCPVTAALRWHAAWWKAALPQVRRPLPRASIPAALS